MCGYLFTHDKSIKNYTKKDKKDFDKIQSDLKAFYQYSVTDKYIESKTEYLYKLEDGIYSSNFDVIKQENPIKFNPAGLALLHKILETPEAGTAATKVDMNNIAIANLAFEAIKTADQELKDQPESFIKNALHFLAHATEEKKFPGFTLFNGNPLHEIIKNKKTEHTKYLKQSCTYTPPVCQGFTKTGLLFGGVITAWALDLKTGILRNGLHNLVFGK